VSVFLLRVRQRDLSLSRADSSLMCSYFSWNVWESSRQSLQLVPCLLTSFVSSASSSSLQSMLGLVGSMSLSPGAELVPLVVGHSSRASARNSASPSSQFRPFLLGRATNLTGADLWRLGRDAKAPSSFRSDGVSRLLWWISASSSTSSPSNPPSFFTNCDLIVRQRCLSLSRADLSLMPRNLSWNARELLRQAFQLVPCSSTNFDNAASSSALQQLIALAAGSAGLTSIVVFFFSSSRSSQSLRINADFRRACLSRMLSHLAESLDVSSGTDGAITSASSST